MGLSMQTSRYVVDPTPSPTPTPDQHLDIQAASDDAPPKGKMRYRQIEKVVRVFLPLMKRARKCVVGGHRPCVFDAGNILISGASAALWSVAVPVRTVLGCGLHFIIIVVVIATIWMRSSLYDHFFSHDWDVACILLSLLVSLL